MSDFGLELEGMMGAMEQEARDRASQDEEETQQMQWEANERKRLQQGVAEQMRADIVAFHKLLIEHGVEPDTEVVVGVHEEKVVREPRLYPVLSRLRVAERRSVADVEKFWLIDVHYADKSELPHWHRYTEASGAVYSADVTAILLAKDGSIYAATDRVSQETPFAGGYIYPGGTRQKEDDAKDMLKYRPDRGPVATRPAADEELVPLQDIDPSMGDEHHSQPVIQEARQRMRGILQASIFS